jgi:hypothetical protein
VRGRQTSTRRKCHETHIRCSGKHPFERDARRRHAAAELTLFTQPEFAGRQMTFRGESRDLAGSGIADQASSAVVRSGRWEVCTQPHFGGDCMILGRGNYPRLDDKIFHRIESVRELSAVASEERTYPVDRYARYSALEVYTLPGFRGQSMKFDDEATSLDRAATDEGLRASSFARAGGNCAPTRTSTATAAPLHPAAIRDSGASQDRRSAR